MFMMYSFSCLKADYEIKLHSDKLVFCLHRLQNFNGALGYLSLQDNFKMLYINEPAFNRSNIIFIYLIFLSQYLSKMS